ncbi:MAG: type II CAAX endopeptidase family protein [Desulfosalsimonadaceae bacterium]
MDAKTIRYDPRPFAVTVAGVIGLEFLAMAFPFTEALWLTGTTRILQSLFILGAVRRYPISARIAGLSRSGMKKGIKRGFLWSCALGSLAAIAGIVIALAGLDPFRIIGVRLPSDKALLIGFFLIAALIGPVAEELLFRGVVYGFLRRFGAAAAILGSSAFFVLAHSYDGIALTHVIGGLVFAATYEYEKNIMVPITLHVLGNLALFSTAFFQ